MKRVVQGDEVRYIHTVRYDIKILEALVQRPGCAGLAFEINPAIWKAFDMSA
jgi:hypothetical protein